MGGTSHGLAYEGFFGNANIQAGTPMAPDTVFWLLSMTKTLTAVACMQLIEQGKLDPEQSAGEILPQLASPRVSDGFDAEGVPILRPAKGPITVRHLLTHTSGYTYPNWSEMLTRYEQVTGLPDVAALQNKAFEAPLEFDPGGRWEYGISMDWIGKIIEEITGVSLEVYFPREHLRAARHEGLGLPDRDRSTSPSRHPGRPSSGRQLGA